MDVAVQPVIYPRTTISIGNGVHFLQNNIFGSGERIK